MPRIRKAMTDGFDATVQILQTCRPDEIFDAVTNDTKVTPFEMANYPAGVLSTTHNGQVVKGTYLTSLKEIHTNIGGYENFYSMLYDEESKRVFANMSLYRVYPFNKLANDVCDSVNPIFFDENIIKTGKTEVFADICDPGEDTVSPYLRHCGRYSRIYVYEVFENPGEDLPEKCKDIVFRKTSADLNLDAEIKERLSFIKIDASGAGINTIEGAAGHIKNHSPKLAVNISRFDTDFREIPSLIHSINPNYKFYVRHYHFNPEKPLPDMKTILYAV